MNKTKIDWADSTWNPVTGCLHNCEYCYARKIANRFGGKYMPYGNGINILDTQFDGEKGIDPYPFKFEPTFHRYRLDEPKRKTKGKTIFVGSMCDLFGEWVPDEWIQEVFKACEDAPQHRYLFLTKNPKRYYNLKLTENMVLNHNLAFGATCTDLISFQHSLDYMQDFIGKKFMTYDIEDFSYKFYGGDGWWNHKQADFKDRPIMFLSIEPLQEDVSSRANDIIGTFDWIIIGAETGNRKGKVIPQKEWVDSISEQCKAANVPIFMKESLKELMGEDFMQEFPWDIGEV